ncbi:heparan-alpha-glucosaminide N-acetyltransferase domain-containing protein [Streptomyces sp. ME02-8801-2C]|uniref:heparan-alpha-glucosaminide N-acetyltransferase domain-containing protein n=1 Tax=Streptomyces sp. ME02-8801-2C TaxID=3028680 RepID=UPI0029A6958E|nr:heparan-alpha-glucosaminide N-acetyltransferase domain-containing protein [Streptomyces sp. ME02-8801-2C]MDX3451117.1 heparan-alpha-glucosaminide N-acetyltransferase domain-containing protein [Streptomyces sp. ME02-8801-2C]
MPLAAPRIAGVDVARGLALLGMFSVHVFGDFEPDGSPTVAWQLAGGRSSATFALVAGVGLALTTGGRTPRIDRGSLASVTARALSVGLIGLLLGYAANAGGLSVDVILAFYALLFLLALPLLALRARTLACLALALGVVSPFLVHLLRGALPEPAFDGDPTLQDVVTDPAGLLGDLLVHGDYPVLAWTAYLCAGLAIGRLDLFDRRTATRLLTAGLALAATAWLVCSFWLLRRGGLERLRQSEFPDATGPHARDQVRWDIPDGTTWWSMLSRAPHSTSPFDMLHTLGAATALLAAVLLLTRITVVRRALMPLAAAGSMPLTLYTAHVLFLATGALNGSTGLQYAVLVTGSLLFAVVWRLTRGRGPLEALVAEAARRARKWERRRRAQGSTPALPGRRSDHADRLEQPEPTGRTNRTESQDQHR